MPEGNLKQKSLSKARRPDHSIYILASLSQSALHSTVNQNRTNAQSLKRKKEKCNHVSFSIAYRLPTVRLFPLTYAVHIAVVQNTSLIINELPLVVPCLFTVFFCFQGNSLKNEVWNLLPQITPGQNMTAFGIYSSRSTYCVWSKKEKTQTDRWAAAHTQFSLFLTVF